MKKLFMAIALVMGLNSLSHAVVSPPLDARGNSLYTLDWAGAKPCTVTVSSTTLGVLCASGRGVVYGVAITSPTNNTEYLVFRDSAVGNNSSSSFTAVGIQQEPNTVFTQMPNSIFVKFPVPIQFTNGLSVNMAVTAQQGENWTVLYRPLTATE